MSCEVILTHSLYKIYISFEKYCHFGHFRHYCHCNK
nr:MAG TPA: Protein of unknown function (DUF3587) [Caudoviricetes sp.]